MHVSWNHVIYDDIIGSILTLGFAVWCAILSQKWAKKKSDDVFRQYIFLLTLSIVFFAVSRSVGHLLKQVLIFSDMRSIWEQIAPFSGAINSVSFVVIFAFGIYFYRFQKIHVEIEKYKNNLEEMIVKRTGELERTNIELADEIIEHRHTERALKENKACLQAILDNATLPMYLKDIEGKYILINNEYERLAHIANAAIIGLNDFDVFSESIAARFRSQDEDVKMKNRPIEFEETIPMDDGEHTFLISRFPVRDEGVVYAVGGVFTDITRRKTTEEKLATEQERLAVTLRSIGDGVITTDTSGRVVLVNKVAEALTGWSQGEASGRPFEEVFHLLTKSREHYRNPVETVLRTGQIFLLEESVILVSRQGRELVIADSGAPIRDKDSKIIGVVVVFRDITRQMQLEEESLKVKKLESVGVLAGGIAHDFNNILAAILGNINLARLDASIKEETQRLLLAAEKASLRARDLTQQLLTFSKGGEPVKETSSLQEIIRDSANFVLHGEKVACKFEFSDDLRLVDIDKGQISQVIQNMIINANHAMPNGGLIKVGCENIDSSFDPRLFPGENYVKISISDNGIGIPANVIEKIFDPYFSTKSKGSGLGLAICHSIISKHNGHIDVTSRPGEGTTFTIILPSLTHSKQKHAAPDESIAQVQHAKILIMDDDEVLRELARDMLSHLGHDVVVAQDGEEAIRLYGEALNSTAPFDLTIMDLTIPGGMGGEDAVKELLKINPEAKVIVSSGYSNDKIMANYKQYGFCAALVKPYQIKDLMKVMGEVLG
ncbi:MAG: PAS domain-containing protein [Desulfobulbaceae bacterium]|nr:PAS domain-containing protein [Desulfobulbaceae bacterium]HIJ90989.1 PAS domain-containing protein [Deltaproteobacteria bacterium]